MKSAPAALLALTLAACATERDLEFVEQPITSLDELEGGVVALGLGPMARAFVIHPEMSPGAAQMTEFARAACGSGRPIHATAWIRDRSPKNAPAADAPRWPYVIVRLADTPDPRAARDARGGR